MGWTQIRADDRETAWERSDGYVTVRLRRRADDSWAATLDCLVQAPEGSHYEQEVHERRADAMALVESWQAAYDRDE